MRNKKAWESEKMKLCPVKVIDSDEDILKVPKNWYTTLLKKVSFGGATEEVNCSLTTTDHQILLSKPLAEKLNIPSSVRSLHLIQKEDTLFLGPLIGIITSGFTSIQNKPVGDRSYIFSRLMRLQSKYGVVLVLFGKEHINWDHGTIKGYTYSKDGWEQVLVPFPNVIYDRLPNRKVEGDKSFLHVKKKLQEEYLIPWFNPGFFNKLDLFERIEQDVDAQGYLPETHGFTSFSIIERMLANYGHVYVKPQNGSLGNGIHQIIYSREEGAYYCRFKDRDGNKRLQKYQTLERLVKKVFNRQSLSQMMVQQGISLIKHDGHCVDFRVHTNKDEEGKWRVSAIAAKVAGSGSPTTHLKNGGEVKTLDEIFEDPKQKKQIQTHITEVSLSLSRAIERNMEGLIAEIGFDFGLDHDGKVWLFEANSKPGRSIFTHPEMREFERLTRKLMIVYAIFLTKQAILQPEELFL